MITLAQWSGFQWIGIGVSALALLAALILLYAVIAVFWDRYGLSFMCRKPKTEIIWSTYRGDVRTGEGKRVKCNKDLRITSLVGVSWRSRWLFGIMTFKRDTES